MSPDVNPRQRNRRGEGGRLREDILAAAASLLSASGSEDAVTLRAIARRAGISAPSIYPHFTDRDAVLEALIARTFAQLEATLRAAAEQSADPRAALSAACRAYLDFADRRGAGYRILFDRRRRADTRLTERRRPDELLGAGAFGALVRLVGAYRASSGWATDGLHERSTALWVALHGYATLRQSVPAFPWPGDDRMLTTLIERIAGPDPMRPDAGTRADAGRA